MATDDYDYITIPKAMGDKIRSIIETDPLMKARGLKNPSRLVQYIIIKFFDERPDVRVKSNRKDRNLPPLD